ncbi:MAG: hypothetical protein HC817_03075 [Saprospiraceae bacterium]|nr:hypothetical protein [Saprospiraceae bacterium]
MLGKNRSVGRYEQDGNSGKASQSGGSEKIVSPQHLSYDGNCLWIGNLSGNLFCFLNPILNCARPIAPILNGGLAACPGEAVEISGVSFSLRSTAQNVQIVVEKYPYGAKNEVFRSDCARSSERIF